MPAAGRPAHSTSGPVTRAVTTLTAPAQLSLTPIARPRSDVSVRSAINAVEATFAAAQPMPTRNVPSVTDQNAGVNVTSAAPTSATATPGVHHLLAPDAVGHPAERDGEAEHPDRMEHVRERDRR